jgi:hypothetical protein
MRGLMGVIQTVALHFTQPSAQRQRQATGQGLCATGCTGWRLPVTGCRTCYPNSWPRAVLAMARTHGWLTRRSTEMA